MHGGPFVEITIVAGSPRQHTDAQVRQAAAQPEVRGAEIQRAKGLRLWGGVCGWGGSRPLQPVCLLSRAATPLPFYCHTHKHTYSVSRGRYQSNDTTSELTGETGKKII